jgi:hypothetical protein
MKIPHKIRPKRRPKCRPCELPVVHVPVEDGLSGLDALLDGLIVGGIAFFGSEELTGFPVGELCVEG